jgi:hypothetical protein
MDGGRVTVPKLPKRDAPHPRVMVALLLEVTEFASLEFT